MLHLLINHNEDLRKLHSDGYDLEIKNGHLIVHGVPYVNTQRQVLEGSLVSILELAGNLTIKPEQHVMHFIGEIPCDSNGNALESIINSKNANTLTQEISVNYSFSSKPHGGYSDYYHKVETYAAMLYAHAQSIDPSVTPKKHRVIKKQDDSMVHEYFDTNSSTSGVTAISEKLKDLKVAIIGLGGTGSYILDLVSKTWVKEIHIFDGDILLTKNSFRIPGAVPIDVLEKDTKTKKTAYLSQIYSKIHTNIISHDYYIDESNLSDIAEIDFVFVCLDQGESKKAIFDYLISTNTSFIDVGIGVNNIEGMLNGSARVTTVIKNKTEHVNKRISFGENADGLYNSNIQLAELNALNAAMAVIKWKKIFGVYIDQTHELNSTYDVSLNTIINDETET